MLIGSPRHRAGDLALWRELEAADVLRGQELFDSPRVARSLEALERFCRGGGVYCAVSWGKDSVVVAHQCRCVDRQVPLVYFRQSNANPDCDLVRDRYLALWPGQPYEEVPVEYGDLVFRSLDGHDEARATDRLWHRAIRQVERRLGLRRVIGVRAAESAGRRIRCRVWGTTSPRSCAPIAWWATGDVFAYLAVHDLPVHPAYACTGEGRWPRDRLRVAALGHGEATNFGRAEWEREYYGTELRRMAAQQAR